MIQRLGEGRAEVQVCLFDGLNAVEITGWLGLLPRYHGNGVVYFLVPTKISGTIAIEAGAYVVRNTALQLFVATDATLPDVITVARADALA